MPLAAVDPSVVVGDDRLAFQFSVCPASFSIGSVGIGHSAEAIGAMIVPLAAVNSSVVVGGDSFSDENIILPIPLYVTPIGKGISSPAALIKKRNRNLFPVFIRTAKRFAKLPFQAGDAAAVKHVVIKEALIAIAVRIIHYSVSAANAVYQIAAVNAAIVKFQFAVPIVVFVMFGALADFLISRFFGQ